MDINNSRTVNLTFETSEFKMLSVNNGSYPHINLSGLDSQGTVTDVYIRSKGDNVDTFYTLCNMLLTALVENAGNRGTYHGTYISATNTEMITPEQVADWRTKAALWDASNQPEPAQDMEPPF